METIRLTWAEFKDLPEYSCSLPTGVIIGKRWKRNDHAFRRMHAATCTAPHLAGQAPPLLVCGCMDPYSSACPECIAANRAKKPSWVMGEYVEAPTADAEYPPNTVIIIWRRIVVRLAIEVGFRSVCRLRGHHIPGPSSGHVQRCAICDAWRGTSMRLSSEWRFDE